MTKLEMYCVTNKRLNFLEDCNYNLSWVGLDQCPKNYINSNNKMIARLTSLRYLLNKTEYENKKIIKPAKWSKSLNNYSTNLEGIRFENLSYDQFMVISKYSDDS